MNVIILLLDALGLFFLFRYASQSIKAFRAAEDKRAFFTFHRFRHVIGLSLAVGIPLALGNFIFPRVFPELMLQRHVSEAVLWWLSVVLAFFISGVWAVYVQRLDIYQSEARANLIATFALAALATRYLCGWMYGQLDAYGFSLYTSDSPVYQFLYCVFAIGGIEELCKILPVLILLLIRKSPVDEPYDYILYASVSALGFAFVENIDYIFYSGLRNIGGRALYAAVAHMTFTSIFCYALMLWRYGYSRIKGVVLLPLFFLLAMAAHGFYDFWLINNWVVEYQALTTVFFLITVHLWVTMKNNAINVSNYYSPDASLNNDSLRYYLIISLAGLLMLGYLAAVLMYGRAAANRYLFFDILAYGYLIFYLAFGLSRYKIVRDELNPFQVPFDFFVPKPSVAEKEEHAA
ncbi:MAG: PrsW family intramembrane metalloprotease [Phaeodactylibacter sp.]|nr:PrsW family intramembrane metalloprotease [Phaeodactylibacter sp.]